MRALFILFGTVVTTSLLIAGGSSVRANNAKLNPAEAKVAQYIEDHSADAIKFLIQLVNVNSGTNNYAGVAAIADMIEPKLKALDFQTWREDMIKVNRGVHLFATHKGSGPRLLLIGHLDTVFEKNSDFQQWKDLGNGWANAPGAADMKGGDVVMLQALEALQDAGLLKDMNITIALTGDEEAPGADADGTFTTTRSRLIELGGQSDYALSFEPATQSFLTAKTLRRGSSTWFIDVAAKTGHSSLIFSKDYGPGAAYPLSKILNKFYDELRSDPKLTFNPGNIVGAMTVDRKSNYQASVTGKDNVIAATSSAFGDLRFVSQPHREQARDKMRKIVDEVTTQINSEYSAQAAIQTKITFSDRYPAMEETAGNIAMLKLFSEASVDLGIGPVSAFKENSGAADISFVAPLVKGALCGFGPMGKLYHSKDEVVEIATIKAAAKRTAIFMMRLHGAKP